MAPDDEVGTRTEPAAGAEASGSPLAVASVDSGQPALDKIVKIVKGGVAVPFYVILLAMFGAGINMTLKVPEVQRSYEDVLPEARSSFLWLNPILAAWRLRQGRTEAPAVVSGKTAGDIRRELIENYMYLLSAPFLAVAMYYLLQVLAEQVTQPVLVLMAFATGLVSRAVIGGIIDFAESRLLSEKRRQGEPSAQLSAEVAAKAAKARQAEAEAAVRALDEARAKQTTVEAAATAAKEAADKAEQKRTTVEAAAGTGGATQVEADTAREEAEKATREAEAKQAKARAAADATEKAAKMATEKQAEAEAAVKATVQPAQATAQEAKAKAAKADADAKAAQEAEAEQAVAQTATAASAGQEAEAEQAENQVAGEATEKAA